MADPRQGVLQRSRQLSRPRSITLQEMVGHALRGLRTDAGQNPERLDQAFQALGGRNRIASHGLRTAS